MTKLVRFGTRGSRGIRFEWKTANVSGGRKFIDKSLGGHKVIGVDVIIITW